MPGSYQASPRNPRELGLELRGEGSVEGGRVDRVVGLDGVRAEIAMLQSLGPEEIVVEIAERRPEPR